MMTPENDATFPVAAVLLFALELGVNFGRRFRDQEETAAEQDQIAAGEAVTADVEQRVFRPRSS